ncbi:Stp1/IreP family PP2C-type Ser/Thr phosphatase [Baekduia soli]|uniref:Stp1/IreP family PP2C-type Ser/Thr phosphatase n=1 Tax=Baekduia soli TaxID=496014 RepID=A0A5B8U1B1_9ACTN|nr:Stp1/IreP family PP2C-type Ser/Thr phosphatase [Baekduia soli]QEC46809.1 Stp1/IreP family PP2C-type Ser/Thr phosphatase [Baekduia soli]
MLRVADHAARTDTGRQRPANEDSYWVSAPLFVLADGMGGAQAGEVASQTAVEVFKGGLPDGPGSAEERLAGLVERANAAVHALAQADEQHAGMGTTLTAAYVAEDDLAIAHVGDSRFYVLRDGELSQLTDDHSLVGELVRRGQISAEEAEDHPQRSIITRALGIEGEVVVDHLTWPVRDGDVFLLCSDGLTSMVHDAEVARIISAAGSLGEAASRLVAAANGAGGRDNITVVLFRVEEITPGEGGVLGSQRTMAGAAAPSAEEIRAAAPAPTARGAVQAAERPVVAPRAPRPPQGGRPGGPSVRRRRRWSGPLKALTAVVVLLAIVASGAWIASRAVYFVATDDDGYVALYQGLPYDLPGLSLYQQQFISGVPVQTLSPRVRDTVTAHKLRSQHDAVDLVRQLERGDLAGQS